MSFVEIVYCHEAPPLPLDVDILRLLNADAAKAEKSDEVL